MSKSKVSEKKKRTESDTIVKILNVTVTVIYLIEFCISSCKLSIPVHHTLLPISAAHDAKFHSYQMFAFIIAHDGLVLSACKFAQCVGATAGADSAANKAVRWIAVASIAR